MEQELMEKEERALWDRFAALEHQVTVMSLPVSAYAHMLYPADFLWHVAQRLLEKGS